MSDSVHQPLSVYVRTRGRKRKNIHRSSYSPEGLLTSSVTRTILGSSSPKTAMTRHLLTLIADTKSEWNCLQTDCIQSVGVLLKDRTGSTAGQQRKEQTHCLQTEVFPQVHNTSNPLNFSVEIKYNEIVSKMLHVYFKFLLRKYLSDEIFKC